MKAKSFLTRGQAMTRTDDGALLGGGGAGILLVEDDDEVRNVVGTMLLRGGYMVFSASSAREALEVFHRKSVEIQLVLIDVGLPGCTDLGLACQLLSQNSALPILMTSGHSEDRWGRSVMRERGFCFIQKPYDYAELLQAVGEAVDLS